MSKRCKLGLILSHFINCQIPKKLTKIESTQTTRSCTMWRSWKEQEVKGKKSCFHGTKEYDLFISSLCLQFWIKDYNLKHLWKAHHSSLKAVNPSVLESTKLQKNIFSLLPVFVVYCLWVHHGPFLSLSLCLFFIPFPVRLHRSDEEFNRRQAALTSQSSQGSKNVHTPTLPGTAMTLKRHFILSE